MLTSANYVRDEGVLNPGQVIAQDMDMSANAITYVAAVPGMNFFMPDGAQLIFTGGIYRTSNPDIIAELDKVAGLRTSLIRRAEVAAPMIADEIAVAAVEAGASTGGAAKDSSEATVRIQQARAALTKAGSKA
jgi:hypothetical protein